MDSQEALALFEFKSDYIAEVSGSSFLKSYKQKSVSKAFEEIVGWCINSETEKLKEVINDESQPIYNDVIYSHCKDVRSNYNLVDIIATIGNVNVLKIIIENMPKDKYLNVGRHGLNNAIRKGDLDMISCIFLYKYRFNSYEYHLKFAYEPERFDIFKMIVAYLKENRSYCVNFINFGETFPRAVADGRMDLIELFLANEANPNEDNLNRFDRCYPGTPLCIAMKKGNFELVEFLIEKGSNKLLPHDIEDLPFEYFNMTLRNSTVEWKLQEKRNVKEMIQKLNSKLENLPKQGRSYERLVKIFRSNRLNLVKTLLALQCEQGFGLDSRYPLHNAVKLGLYDETKILLENGASMFVYDNEENLPIDYLKKI